MISLLQNEGFEHVSGGERHGGNLLDTRTPPNPYRDTPEHPTLTSRFNHHLHFCLANIFKIYQAEHNRFSNNKNPCEINIRATGAGSEKKK